MKNNELPKKIASSLEKLNQVQRILQWEVAKKEQLSPIQIQFLLYLNDHGEALRTVTHLSEEFDLTKATVSDAVSTLTNKGFIIKIQQETDKRSHVLELTKEGIVIVERIAGWRGRLLESIDTFSDEEQTHIFDLLNRLIVKLSRDKVISVARMCNTCGNFLVINKMKSLYKCNLTGEEFSINGINLGCDFYINS